jgi:hypothetical protein
MRKTPIMLIVDDGTPITDTFPFSFQDRFCALAERYGVRGKFSIIPMPTGRGDIV